MTQYDVDARVTYTTNGGYRVRHGRVVEVNGDRRRVLWDGDKRTWVKVSALRPESPAISL